jgi:hypothetical protein
MMYRSRSIAERRRIDALNGRHTPIPFWIALAGGILFLSSLWLLVELLTGSL